MRFNVLTTEDWGFLKTKPLLVEYLAEKTPYGQCGRLVHYQQIAKTIMETLKKMDELAHLPPNYRGLLDDQELRESLTADMIRKGDAEHGLRNAGLWSDCQAVTECSLGCDAQVSDC